MPKCPLGEALQAEIDRLAQQVPDAPRFVPHVTLVGGVEASEADMLQAARQLAARLKPYHVTLDRVSCGSIFHQCVYILCTTNEDTMQAGAAAREACGLDPTAAYMPHLSLLYSDIDQQQRQHIAAEEQARLLEGPQALLGQQGAEGRRFKVTSLAVWRTPPEDKALASWQLVEEIELKGA